LSRGCERTWQQSSGPGSAGLTGAAPSCTCTACEECFTRPGTKRVRRDGEHSAPTALLTSIYEQLCKAAALRPELVRRKGCYQGSKASGSPCMWGVLPCVQAGPRTSVVGGQGLQLQHCFAPMPQPLMLYCRRRTCMQQPCRPHPLASSNTQGPWLSQKETTAIQPLYTCGTPQQHLWARQARQRMRGCTKHLQAYQQERARHLRQGGGVVSQCQVRQCLTYMAGEETRACTASGPLLPQKAARLGLPSRHTASAWLCQQALEQRRQLLKQPVSRQAARLSKQARRPHGGGAASFVTSSSLPGSPPCGASAGCTAAWACSRLHRPGRRMHQL